MIFFYNSFVVRFIISFIICIFLQTVLSTKVQTQTLTVHGVVSTSPRSVRYASITFIDKLDTTTRVTVRTDTSGSYSIDMPTSVQFNENKPSSFQLAQNYPNPFQTSTAVSFELEKQSDVLITIYDILGREVKSFNMGIQSAGVHGIRWDGKNNFSEKISTGIYFYRIQVQGETSVKKMVYGLGEKNNIVTLPSMLPVQAAKMNYRTAELNQAQSYIVRIANTDSTFPAIVNQQFDSVIVQNNATQDFSVNTIATFPDQNTALVYLDSTQQYIRGFGGANILEWRPDMTPSQVQKAFGNGDGQIGFSLLRLRIPYNLTEASLSIQIPTAQLAQSYGAVVFASPWTPPAWMKTSNDIVGGSVYDTSYASFAAHLKTFSDYMANHGAPLFAISIQNEPDWHTDYESCDWNAAQMINFLKNYAASIGLPMIAPESYYFRKSFSDSILSDPGAARNLAVVGGHIYGGGIDAHPLAASKGKEVWMTEHLVLDTSLTAVIGTGKEINDCMKAGWNAYIWWYIVRYYGPIDESGNLTKRGYVMSQFARFARPGYFRVKVVEYNTARLLVDVTAYRSGSKKVIVVVNRRTTEKIHSFTIWNGTVGTFTPYVTSASKNCEQQSNINYKNGTFAYTLEPLSVTTFVSE
jgi:glucuronoarabinoxylan endo-1,4-beta-xylanase